MNKRFMLVMGALCLTGLSAQELGTNEVGQPEQEVGAVDSVVDGDKDHKDIAGNTEGSKAEDSN